MTNLHEAYDVALLDLDGVVYVGAVAIPGAPAALARAKRDGMRLAYVTNNASRTPAAVAALLSGMDVPAEPEDVVTSAQAAARLLADKLPAQAKVLVIGSAALRLAVRERGLVPVSVASEEPQAVVQGYGPGIDYSRLAEGGLAVRAGALFVGTNADATLPGRRGFQPGNGAMLRVIAHAAGVEPVIAGKPEPPLHRESVIRTGARHPLVVGDRLDTDIEAARRAGCDSLLVLTGVTRPADLVPAAEGQRPTYIGQSLEALLAPYPEISLREGAASCGGWTATAGLALTGGGAPIDGLRALCAAAWSASEPASIDRAEAALEALYAAGLPR
ncbi:MAG: HAD-IIA family hydrolase [Nocardiopsaceae bacterium]|nr:HAD-IIA family hydrolase [Nocardiopsaceae bacterium]